MMRQDREEMTMVGRLFTPTQREAGTAPTGWLVARRLITVVWLVVCLVQIAIWGIGDIAGGHLTFPWWLPTVGSGVATLVLLSVITGMVGRKRG